MSGKTELRLNLLCRVSGLLHDANLRISRRNGFGVAVPRFKPRQAVVATFGPVAVQAITVRAVLDSGRAHLQYIVLVRILRDVLRTEANRSEVPGSPAIIIRVLSDSGADEASMRLRGVYHVMFAKSSMSCECLFEYR